MKEKLELIAHCITTFKFIKVEIFNCTELTLWKTFKKNLFLKNQLFSSKDQFKSFIKEQPDISIVHIIDMLEINYFFVKTGDYICLLGPYMPRVIDINSMKKIIRKLNLSVDLSMDIQRYYNSIPLISTEDVLLCAQTIVGSVYGNHAIPKDYEVKINNTIKDDSLIEYTNLSIDYISHTYDLEQLFMENITQGNSVESKKILKEIQNRILSSEMYSNTLNLNSHKQSHLIVRTLLRIAATRAGVPAYHLHLLTTESSLALNNIHSAEKLNTLFDKLIDDTCTLVRTYRFQNYSPIINNAINYILSNLNKPLKLSDISDKLMVSSAYLSMLFKKELNITITEYILNTKLKEASILLTCTSLNIRDISSQVGILDYNYFSRLFKKKYNLTPSEFRKNLHKN